MVWSWRKPLIPGGDGVGWSAIFFGGYSNPFGIVPPKIFDQKKLGALPSLMDLMDNFCPGGCGS